MADLNALARRGGACSGASADAFGGVTGGTGEPHTGTTIVACSYDGGVVLGADGRVSAGDYISNRASNKITAITDSVFLLRSGSAADTQAVGDYVNYFAQQLSSELGAEPSVQTIAKLVAMMNYNNKNNLVGAMIVAGYDAQAGGQVYGIPIGGTVVPESWAIDGSGSTYIWGYMDSAWKPGMTREEAEAFVVEALALAMARDASSGGVIRTVTLNKDGATHRYLNGNEVPLYHEELLPPSVAAAAAVRGGGSSGGAASMVVG